jgi:hypothetical protein
MRSFISVVSEMFPSPTAPNAAVGDNDVGEADLVELLHAVGLLDRSNFDALALRVEEEHREPLLGRWDRCA